MASTITSAWELIDPTKAMQYLETMNGNRSVRQSRVDYYASQMKAGLWRPVPQGIVFDSTGSLVDGNHRMWAVVESGATVKIMVSRGMSPEDVVALDTGLGRTYADTAHFAGWDSTPDAAAIVKMLVAGVSQRARMVPPDILHQWQEHYADGVAFGRKVRLMTRGVGTKVIGIAVAVPFARAFYSQDVAMLERFAAILKSGSIEVEVDRAAITLRDAWLSKRLGTTATEQYFKTEAAIRAFVERRAIKTLQRAEKELFPVPKLPAALKYEITQTRGTRRLAHEAKREKAAA